MSLIFIRYNQSINHGCPTKQVGHMYTVFSTQTVSTQHYGEYIYPQVVYTPQMANKGELSKYLCRDVWTSLWEELSLDQMALRSININILH